MPPPQGQGHGLLGALALGADQGHQGGHLGATWPVGGQFDPRNSMAPRVLDYVAGASTTPERQYQPAANPCWSPAAQESVKTSTPGGEPTQVAGRGSGVMEQGGAHGLDPRRC